VTALAANLVLLSYFKYVNFFIENINHIVGTALQFKEVFLPLGISFFTFTQIAFLVDTYRGKVKEYSFIHYTLFVTYFPHLIAGPVLHHSEMMPQFAKRDTCEINWRNVAVGLTIFILGLSKKVFIADTLATFSTPIFKALLTGGQPMLLEAWTGALSYTLQLYFDFSAYSDMAIGLSLIFNVQLPINFNSPYKATSIIDFWRCWHITLSRFLRDYLYIPLGGNRKGKFQRYFNLIITMLLEGLWHGAGWTFIIWGGLHGFYLMINHVWRGFKAQINWHDGGKWSRSAARALTFFTVVIGWVFFRSDSFSSAMTMLHGMFGMNGVSLPVSFEVWWNRYPNYLPHQEWLVFKGLNTLVENSVRDEIVMLTLGMFIVFKLPNIQQLVLDSKINSDTGLIDENINILQWKPTLGWAIMVGIIFFASFLCLNAPSEFLYFQF
jgi:alginate O-acetyltransferase complex protein AlgI